MSALNPAQPIRRDPPWWVVLLAIPLFGTSLVFAFFAGLGGVSWIDAVTASRVATRSVDLAPGGTVAITATSAAVSIVAGPDGQVSVEDWMQVRSPTRSLAKLALDSFRESSLSATGSGVAVGIPVPENFNLTAFQLDRRVTVRVPADAALKLRGDSVAADLQNLRGSLDLSVSSGAVRLKGVVVTGADRITASAGAIDFEGSLERGSLDIETDSGAIRLSLPAGTNATYDLATTSGAILVQPENGRPTAAAGSDRSLTGILGDGVGAAIKLRANSGAIAVRVA